MTEPITVAGRRAQAALNDIISDAYTAAEVRHIVRAIDPAAIEREAVSAVATGTLTPCGCTRCSGLLLLVGARWECSGNCACSAFYGRPNLKETTDGR